MNKNIRNLIALTLVLAFCFCGCVKKGPKEYEYTTQRPYKTMVPTITYGCDLYTADLISIKKMSGMIYRGDAFGEIPDEETAVNTAVQALHEVYGNAFDGYEPLVVTFNERAGCWVVHGTPRDNRNTGVSFVCIRKNSGEVVMMLKNPKE